MTPSLYTSIMHPANSASVFRKKRSASLYCSASAWSSSSPSSVCPITSDKRCVDSSINLRTCEARSSTCAALKMFGPAVRRQPMIPCACACMISTSSSACIAGRVALKKAPSNSPSKLSSAWPRLLQVRPTLKTSCQTWMASLFTSSQNRKERSGSNEDAMVRRCSDNACPNTSKKQPRSWTAPLMSSICTVRNPITTPSS
mmetsp:Transcript_53576/g.125419  ORF Transcript_53576/g.125419 Transcript_53576/m.125419 type:complete len:201 (-) Transcript_53576:427-1029(-)